MYMFNCFPHRSLSSSNERRKFPSFPSLLRYGVRLAERPGVCPRPFEPESAPHHDGFWSVHAFLQQIRFWLAGTGYTSYTLGLPQRFILPNPKPTRENPFGCEECEECSPKMEWICQEPSLQDFFFLGRSICRSALLSRESRKQIWEPNKTCCGWHLWVTSMSYLWIIPIKVTSLWDINVSSLFLKRSWKQGRTSQETMCFMILS